MSQVSQVLAKHLAKLGVTHVFGIPGRPITSLVLNLDEQGITYVLSKHETGAGLEAAGYAYASNRLGVALVTAGPGGINMLNAAGQANYSRLPVLFITGSPPISTIGRVTGQDSTMFGTDLVKMFEPVTKFSARVDRGSLLKGYLQHAIEQALTGSRGPVHLCIPLDVLEEEIEDFELELPLEINSISTHLNDVVTNLNEAKHPLLLVGSGVHSDKAYEEIIQFAKKWSIPIATTPGGKGTIATSESLYLGPYGLGGNEETDSYIREGIDVLVVVGSLLSDLELPALPPSLYPKMVIQFADEQKFIGKSIPVPTIPVIGTMKSNLQVLLSMDNETGTRSPLPVINEPEFSNAEEATCLRGQQVMEVLNEELPEDHLMFGDAGSHSFYAIRHLPIKQPGSFYFEEVYATMGRAIGYAIGAKLADPSKTVVCLTGDGCMMMAGTEVSTAVNYQVPVIFIILNNQSIDMVHKGMSRHLGKAVGTTYPSPLDGAMFGISLGAKGYTCQTTEELRAALRAALDSHDIPTVINIVMDTEEIPPTMKRG